MLLYEHNHPENKNIKIKNDYRKETFCLKLFELINLKMLIQ